MILNGQRGMMSCGVQRMCFGGVTDANGWKPSSNLTTGVCRLSSFTVHCIVIGSRHRCLAIRWEPAPQATNVPAPGWRISKLPIMKHFSTDVGYPTHELYKIEKMWPTRFHWLRPTVRTHKKIVSACSSNPECCVFTTTLTAQRSHAVGDLPGYGERSLLWAVGKLDGSFIRFLGATGKSVAGEAHLAGDGIQEALPSSMKRSSVFVEHPTKDIS